MWNEFQRLAFVFNGGKTKRYHTEDTLTSQTVADHSFGVAMLIELMAPGCRKELLLAGLTHDLAEHLVGDVAAPVKRANIELRAILQEAENGLLNDTGLNYEADLTQAEMYVLKAADYIDGMMFCIRERRMGSKVVVHIYNNYKRYVEKVVENLPPEAVNIFGCAKRMWEEANVS